MSERRLSILFSTGRAGSLKGWEDCCAIAGSSATTRRLNRLESRLIIVAATPQLSVWLRVNRPELHTPSAFCKTHQCSHTSGCRNYAQPNFELLGFSLFRV